VKLGSEDGRIGTKFLHHMIKKGGNSYLEGPWHAKTMRLMIRNDYSVQIPTIFSWAAVRPQRVPTGRMSDFNSSTLQPR